MSARSRQSPGEVILPSTRTRSRFGEQRIGEQRIYSTHFIQEEQVLANHVFLLFAVPLHGLGQGYDRALGAGETNWEAKTHWGLTVSSVTVELFGVGGVSLREFRDELERPLVLSWRFRLVDVDIGPVSSFPFLWHPEERYAGRIHTYENSPVSVPIGEDFAIRAAWGEEAPVSPFPFHLRVTLGVQYQAVIVVG